jgi:multimeric flavodoxin WrbA
MCGKGYKMNLKVLGILGSPRYGGNTDKLLESALSGAEEKGSQIEKIRLCDLSISPCLECHGCDDTGECIQADDMLLLYQKLEEADRLILASPIFFMGVTAQTKALIDRCQSIWVKKYRMKQTIGRGREHRKGFFISVGGSKNLEKFIGAVTTVKAFFATLDFTYAEELLVAGVDEMGAIENHPTAMKEAKEIGERIVSE